MIHNWIALIPGWITMIRITMIHIWIAMIHHEPTVYPDCRPTGGRAVDVIDQSERIKFLEASSHCAWRRSHPDERDRSNVRVNYPEWLAVPIGFQREKQEQLRFRVGALEDQAAKIRLTYFA